MQTYYLYNYLNTYIYIYINVLKQNSIKYLFIVRRVFLNQSAQQQDSKVRKRSIITHCNNISTFKPLHINIKVLEIYRKQSYVTRIYNNCVFWDVMTNGLQ